MVAVENEKRRGGGGGGEKVEVVDIIDVRKLEGGAESCLLA
jgi:hypothetical protein